RSAAEPPPHRPHRLQLPLHRIHAWDQSRTVSCAIRAPASRALSLGQNPVFGGGFGTLQTRRVFAEVSVGSQKCRCDCPCRCDRLGMGDAPGQPLAVRATSLTCATEYDSMTTAPLLFQPNAAAVRAQVERMTASTVFRNSPQLATFLWFIVE